MFSGEEMSGLDVYGIGISGGSADWRMQIDKLLRELSEVKTENSEFYQYLVYAVSLALSKFHRCSGYMLLSLMQRITKNIRLRGCRPLHARSCAKRLCAHIGERRQTR